MFDRRVVDALHLTPVRHPPPLNRAMATFAAALIVGIVFWQPFYGGPRPAFWLSVIAGVVLTVKTWRTAWTLEARRVSFIWLCLWLPVMVSLPASIEWMGTAKVATVLALALPAGTLWVSVLRDNVWRKRIELALTIALLLWAFDGLVQWRLGSDLLGLALLPDGRVTGPFEGLRMSVFLGLLSPIVFFRLYPGHPVSAVLATVVVLFVSTLAGTRTQVLVSALVIFGLFPVLGWRRRIVLSSLFALGLAALFAFSTLHGGKLSQTLGEEHERIPGKPEWFSAWDHRLTYRLRSWSAATAMGLENPTGVGASAFTEAYPAYTFSGDWRIHAPKGTEINHAHHVWFAIFGEEGLPGIAGLLLAIAAAVRWWRSATGAGRRQAAPYTLALATYLFPVCPSPPMYLFWLFPVIWLLVCGFVAALSCGTESDETGPT